MTGFVRLLARRKCCAKEWGAAAEGEVAVRNFHDSILALTLAHLTCLVLRHSTGFLETNTKLQARLTVLAFGIIYGPMLLP